MNSLSVIVLTISLGTIKMTVCGNYNMKDLAANYKHSLAKQTEFCHK